MSHRVDLETGHARRLHIGWLVLAVVSCLVYSPSELMGRVLLDEKWTDGSRTETKRPTEAAIWAGPKADVAVKPGVLIATAGEASQKIWVYFTDKEPVRLAPGEKLVASVSFVPRGALNESSSRGLRIGLFHDSNSPRVESDVNSDAGGTSAPWVDAKGYAAQILLVGGLDSRTKPFDLGKRTNLKSQSLLGSSSDYSKVSGGDPIGLEPDKEYTISFAVEKTAERENTLTCSYKQDEKELSSWSVVDDRTQLGSEPPCDTFDLLYLRLSNKATTAEKLEFTNFKVELIGPNQTAK
jgi:hypothetical protein